MMCGKYVLIFADDGANFRRKFEGKLNNISEGNKGVLKV
jgi:hypothetical protein